MSIRPETDPILARARDHLKRGEYPIAIELLRSLIVLGVTDSSVLETLGVAYSMAGSPGLAVSLLEQTIEEAPQRVAAFVKFSEHLIREGDHAEAMACLMQALQITRDSADVYQNLGIVYQETQNYERAAAAFEAAIRLRPEFVAARFHLGQVCMQTSQHVAAIAAFRQVLELCPTHQQALKLLHDLHDEPYQVEASQHGTTPQVSDNDTRSHTGQPETSKFAATRSLKLSDRESVDITQLAVDLEMRCLGLLDQVAPGKS